MKIISKVLMGLVSVTVLLMGSIAVASNPPDGNKTAYNVKLFDSDKPAPNNKPQANKAIKCGEGQVQTLNVQGRPICDSKPAPQKKKSSSWW
ncbi:MAG: hypothetical protein P1U63_12135 [Coxiellaceae bacterium]|nr:hypothetical protein [Coxiellaceae bacterium]